MASRFFYINSGVALSFWKYCGNLILIQQRLLADQQKRPSLFIYFLFMLFMLTAMGTSGHNRDGRRTGDQNTNPHSAGVPVVHDDDDPL